MIEELTEKVSVAVKKHQPFGFNVRFDVDDDQNIYVYGKNEPITVYGDGSQTRSFCYVDDLIEAFVRLMRTPDSFSGPVNTGNPYEFTILELAKKVIEITNSKSKIEFLNLPKDDPTQRKPDISLAKEKLDWAPNIQLEEGLINTIEYFEKVI